MYDVVVVGGNLAGTSSAIHAASKGLKVALVEKNKEPYNPAHCGEAIHLDTLNYFDLYDMDYIKNPILTTIINVSEKEYALSYKAPYQLVIDRNFIENELLNRATKLGVNVIMGSRMKDYTPPNDIVLGDGSKIKGKIIIDSSGIACQIGKRVGLAGTLRQEDVGVGVQSRVKGNFKADTMKIWFGRPYAPLGYAYLFPLNEEIANFGIGLLGGQKYNLNELLNNYIKHEISGQYQIQSTFRACVPIAAPLTQVYKDNVMITGDAARLTNSLTAGGIRYALISGALAGIVASKYLNNEVNSLELYQIRLKKLVRALNRIYNKKRKMEEEKYFIKYYSRIFKVAGYAIKVAPNFTEKYILKKLQKDRLIIDNLE